ncbi:hypothetical protein [Borreliella americana]|uniref:hypothetical protein n=1 Tax=Borreliella americana TaxID=478807 RepID=UPI001E350C9A|nr:hypothetical protein [Borreliella americana]MCD2332849.1 hypothetical protein [Borreliella americana]MCD2382114.1 hypothetical protein [Borreliella americana]
MNKKMFIICVVFALISSCKNDVSSGDLKSVKQNLENELKGFLDTQNGTKEKELGVDFENPGLEVEELLEDIMQLQEQVESKIAQGVDKDPQLAEEIEKKVKKLKEKILKKNKKKNKDKK